MITRFLDHPLFKLMMLPTRRGLRMLNVATQPILRSIGKVVGGEVLTDAIAFFQAFDGMETGFRRPRRRGARPAAQRRDAATCSSPRHAATPSTRPAYFAGTAASTAELAVDALIVNRSTPTFGELPATRPRAAPTAALYDNLAELHGGAGAGARHLAELLDELGLDAESATVWVPLLAGDVHDLDGLSTIRALLFASSTAAAEPVTSPPCTS